MVHVQTVHKNLMNHADEEYKEAGVTQYDIQNKEPKATDKVTLLATLPAGLQVSLLHSSALRRDYNNSHISLYTGSLGSAEARVLGGHHLAQI